MQVSELVKALNDLMDEYGDLPVVNEYDHEIDAPEFNDDDGRCILVSFSAR